MSDVPDILAKALQIGFDATIKVAIILGFAAVFTIFARRTSAAARHRVWALALTSCLLMPFASLLLPQVQLPILPPPSATLVLTVGPASTASEAPDLAIQTRIAAKAVSHDVQPVDLHPLANGLSILDGTRAASAATAPVPRNTLLDRSTRWNPASTLAVAMLGFWGCGLIVLWTLLGLAVLDIRRRVRHSVSVPMAWIDCLGDLASALHVSRSVRIVCDLKSTIPLATGVFRPTVLMPVEANRWSQESRSYALLHELAHIERRDVFWQLLGQLAVGLYWFNPLIWYAIRRLRIEREWACDDRVIQLTGRASHYAAQLVEIARSASAQHSMVPVVAMAQASDLERRLRAMFDRARSHVPLSRRAAARLAIVSVLMMLSISTIKPVARVFTADARAQSPMDQSGAAPQIKPGSKPQVSPQKKLAVNRQPVVDPTLPERTRMNIHVLNESGRPIVGAKIHASIWFIDPTKPDGPGNRDLLTNTEGIAVLERPKELSILRIWASHPDFVTQYTGWEQKEPHDNGRLIAKDFTFYLSKGIEVGGQIVNEAGEPIENALVEVTVRDDSPVDPKRPNVKINPWIAEGADRAVSDKQGHWVVKNVPANFDRDRTNRMTLRFDHPDYLAQPGEEPGSESPTISVTELRSRTLRTTLKGGIRLTGLVRDSSGKPIAGALVVRGDNPYFQHGSQEERTDDQGHYRLPALAEGDLTLCVVAPGWAPQMRQIKLNSTANQADFQLGPGHPLKLKVVDQTGQPVSGVYVGIEYWRGKQTLYNHKHPDVLDTGIPDLGDDSGNYAWDWAPEDAVSYTFSKRGYITQTVTLTPTGNGPPKSIVLHRDVTIAGNVTDSKTGQLITRFSVFPTLIFGKDFHSQEQDSMVEGTDGKFSVQLDRNDYPYFLLIQADGYRSVRGRSFHLKDGNHHEDFVLERAPVLEGRIINVAGSPAENAKVHLVTANTPLQYNSADHFSGGDPAITDVTGRFKHPPQAGSYKLIVVHPDGYRRLDLEQDAQPGDIQLQPWGQIEGTLWQAGRPVPNASIIVTVLPKREGENSFLRETRQTTTNSDGHFLLPEVPPCRIVLRPLLSVFRSSPITSSRQIPVDLQPGQKLDVELGSHGARVTGRITLEGDVSEEFDLNYSLNYLVRRGSALPPRPELHPTAAAVKQGWTEALWRSDAGEAYMNLHERHFVRFASDGQFLINGVEPGEYDFAISVYDRPEGCLVDPIAIRFVPVTVTADDVKRGRLELPEISVPFPERAKAGEQLPDITLKLTNDRALKLSQSQGKPLLLHGWATWCVPCLEALPNLKAFHTRFGADKLSVVGINLDEDTKVAREYVTKESLSWPQAYVGHKSEFGRRLGMSSAPTYLVVSPSGKLIIRTNEWSSAAKELEKLIAPQ